MSLRDILRKRYLDAVRSVQPERGGKWKFMVVDTMTSQHLNHLLTQFDILEENVTSIEHISNIRAANPSMEALYLIMPTMENIQRIIQDFAQDPPTYAGAHLFFVDGLSDRLFQQLTSSPAMGFLRQCVDLYTDFRAPEAQVFNFQLADAIYDIFNPASRQDLDALVARCAAKLVSVCATIGEYPVIRYHRSSEARHAARSFPQRLAVAAQQALDTYARSNPDFPSGSGSRPRSLLFIADRSLDLCAPLLHEFTYQAMINDLLPIKNGEKFKYKSEGKDGTAEEKTVTLSEDKDQVWRQIRHMHMRDAIDKLMSDFNKFIGDNSAFTDNEKAASLNDMKDMLASLPQFQEMKEQFGLHLSMAQESMDLFERRKLPETAMVEQNASTGATPEGKFPRSIASQLIPLLADPAVNREDRARLIFIYTIFRDGLRIDDRRKLIRHAGLHRTNDNIDWDETLCNLEIMGVRVEKGPGSRTELPKRKQRMTYVANDTDYDLSRYHPVLKGVVEDHLRANLGTDSWPFTREDEIETIPETQRPSSLRSTSDQAINKSMASATGSLRSARPNWHRSRIAGHAASSSATRQRILIFIAGGVTYSEMRSAYQLSSTHDKEVLIGSTSIITPREFLRDIAELGRGKPPELLADLKKEESGLVKMQPNRVPESQSGYGRPAQQRGQAQNPAMIPAHNGSLPHQQHALSQPQPNALAPPITPSNNSPSKKHDDGGGEKKKRGFFKKLH